MNKVYIAGPMTGVLNFGIAFDKAEKFLSDRVAIEQWRNRHG